jgi:fatty acid desaturase
MLKIKSLKDEVRAAGLFERCEGRSWAKYIFLFSIVCGLLAAHATLPFWWSAALIPVTAFFCSVMASMGHEGSHRALSVSPFRNQLMFHISFPLLGGVSAKYWHWKHDVRHHAYPNVADTDPDILLWPMASTALEYRRSSPGRQWFQRNLQGIMFWPLCFLLVWSMRGSAVAHLYRYSKERGRDRGWWADVGCLCIHVVAWVVIPAIIFGPWAIALYAGIWTFVGGTLAAIFAPAHIGMPIVTDPKDIWRLQFETTRRLTMPKWLSFFFIGLDYQLEHHLFPRIPHQRLPKVAEITRRWAAENGVPYHEISYVGGLEDARSFIAKSWSIEPEDIVTIRASRESEYEVAAA